MWQDRTLPWCPECKAKNVTFRFCSKKGHFDSVCRKKLAQKSTVQDPGHASTKHIIADQQLYEIFGKIGDLHSTSWLVSTQIDGVDLQMLVDTGSKFCIITLSSLMVNGKSKHQLNPAMIFKGYGQKPLSCIGMFTAKLSLSGRLIKTDIFVMDEDGTPLMGLLAARDLRLIDAKINSLSMPSKATVQDSESSTGMPDIYQKYPQLFSENLEPVKNLLRKKNELRLMECKLGRKVLSKSCYLWLLSKNAPKVGGSVRFM